MSEKLTLQQAAKLCGVHRNTVLQWITKGKVNYEIQQNSNWRLIDRTELLEFNLKRLESKARNKLLSDHKQKKWEDFTWKQSGIDFDE